MAFSKLSSISTRLSQDFYLLTVRNTYIEGVIFSPCVKNKQVWNIFCAISNLEHPNVSDIFLRQQKANLSQKIKTFFRKMGQIGPLFVFIFVFSTLHNSIINWWKQTWCDWDSNPGRQDGSHIWIHWAIAAPHQKQFLNRHPWPTLRWKILSQRVSQMLFCR